MWESIKSAIGSIAPWIATTLGGPLAGTAVSKLTQVLGLSDSQKSPEAILTAIQNATPDQLLALRKADQEHEQFMAQMQIDSIAKLEELAGADRANARAREIAVRDSTPKVLGYGITSGFFGVLALLMYVNVPPAMHDVLLVMIGALGTSFAGVVSYYFGSSAGSEKKTAMLAQAQPIDMSKVS